MLWGQKDGGALRAWLRESALDSDGGAKDRHGLGQRGFNDERCLSCA